MFFSITLDIKGKVFYIQARITSVYTHILPAYRAFYLY